MRFGWVVPVLVVAALWAFTLRFDFVWDDEHDILFNTNIHALWPPQWAHDTRRPLTALTFALNWAWTGARPWSYRLVNVLLHAVNAALVWSCTRAALRSSRPSQLAAHGAVASAAIATAAATLWAAHPLHTSAVTYVAHRNESLCATLLLAMLAAWQRATRSPRSPESTRWFVLASVAAVLAMLCKEVAIVGPVLLIAYDWAYSTDDRPVGAGEEPLRPSRRVRRGWLLALSTAAYGVAALLYPRVHAAVSQGATAGVSRVEYFRSELGVLVRYLQLSVFPHPLSVDYYDWPVAQTWRQVAPAGLVVLALVGATAWACVRSPRIGWLGLTWFGILAPTSTIVPLGHELLAERRLYLPLAALTVAVVLVVVRVVRVVRVAPARVYGLIALCVAATTLLGITTVRRNLDFRNPLSLFEHDVGSRPGNARLHLNLANQLLVAGRKLEAWPHYERNVALEPRRFKPHGDMAAIAAELGWNDVAAEQMVLALNESPEEERRWINAVTFFSSVGRDLDARQVAMEAVQRFPTSPTAANKLAWLLATARDPAVVDGRVALREAKRAIRLTKTSEASTSAMVTLAAALAASGRFAEARRLATALLEAARGDGMQAWVSVLEPQLAAYSAGERWIASGRPQAPHASPSPPSP